MPTSIQFYCEGLGFEIEASDGKPAPHFDWVLLRINEAELMLNTTYEQDERPNRPEASRVTAHRDTGIYFWCPDVDAAYAYLREKGTHVQEPKIAHYGMKKMYLTDPDGYVLCFQWTAETLSEGGR